jgi:hypothetical protein
MWAKQRPASGRIARPMAAKLLSKIAIHFAAVKGQPSAGKGPFWLVCQARAKRCHQLLPRLRKRQPMACHLRFQRGQPVRVGRALI